MHATTLWVLLASFIALWADILYAPGISSEPNKELYLGFASQCVLSGLPATLFLNKSFRNHDWHYNEASPRGRTFMQGLVTKPQHGSLQHHTTALNATKFAFDKASNNKYPDHFLWSGSRLPMSTLSTQTQLSQHAFYHHQTLRALCVAAVTGLPFGLGCRLKGQQRQWDTWMLTCSGTALQSGVTSTTDAAARKRRQHFHLVRWACYHQRITLPFSWDYYGIHYWQLSVVGRHRSALRLHD